MKYVIVICSLFLIASCQHSPKENNPFVYDSDGTGKTELLWDKLEKQLPPTYHVYVSPAKVNLSRRAEKHHAASAPTLAAYYTDRLTYYLTQRGFAVTTQRMPNSLMLQPVLTDMEAQSTPSDVQSFRMMGRISGQPDLGMESSTVMPSSIRIATRTALAFQEKHYATIHSAKQINRFYLTRDSLDGVMQLLEAAAQDASFVLFHTIQQQLQAKKLKG